MEKLLHALCREGIACQEHYELAPHSSFHIGGRAELAVFPHTREGLVRALELLYAFQIPYCIIGNASNVVFPDEGMRGAVLFTGGVREIRITKRELYADAGVSLTHAARAAAQASLSGMEFAYGIPGTVGGAVVMNAGAYGGCIADICAVTDWFDREDGTMGSFSGDAHAFAYRTSVYAQTDRYVILGARFALKSGERDVIEACMKDHMSRRQTSQPLSMPNAGSVFKRPNGNFAGKLIEDCGLKGLRVGDAEVSEKHAGFIVNRGNATAADVRRLVEIIREVVARETGVTLECEIRFF